MKLLKYLDTVTENIERIEKARIHLNEGIVLSLIGFGLINIVGLIIYIYGYPITSIIFFVFGFIYFLMMIAMVIKREIFSMMIFFKKQGE